jgi:hypothetical protein
MKCVTPGLVKDPRECRIREDCLYWSKLLEKCMYEEWRKAAKVASDHGKK